VAQYGIPEVKTPSQTVAERVRELRRRRDWSAERLGQELKKAGLDWNRSIVANFESGRRPSVSIEEVLALAFVPDRAAASARVREWVRGRHWMARHGGTERTYFTEVPDEEWEPPAPFTDEEKIERRRVREENLRRAVEAGVMTAEFDEKTGSTRYTPVSS
jgi:transcriptional regulator with XRE-family HTH domain